MTQRLIISCAFAFVSFCNDAKKPIDEDFARLYDDATQGLNDAALALEHAEKPNVVASALDKIYQTQVNMKTRGTELEKLHGVHLRAGLPPQLEGKKYDFQRALQRAFSPKSQAVIQKYAETPEVSAALKRIIQLSHPSQKR